MSIAIIVPVTRMAGKLDFLESWLRETLPYEDIFVYLVHDKQDQETGHELHKLLKSINSRNIRLLERYLGNPGSARNLGISAAQEEYIVFWDSDDLGKPSELREVIKANKDAEIIICNYETHDISKNVNILMDHKKSLKKIIESPGLWRFIFKSQALDGKRFEKYSMGEDQLFLEQIGFADKRFAFSDKYVYQYNINRVGSLTYNKDMTDLEFVIRDGLELSKKQNDLAKKFTRNMVLRQTLSLIRHGNVLARVKSIFITIQILLIR